jgi:hypothetical protein
MFSEDQSQKIKLPDFPGERSKPGFHSGSGSAPALKGPITTLSGAASEMSGGSRRAGSTIAVVAAVLLVGGGAAFIALRPKAAPTPAAQPPVAAVVTPSAPEAIEIKLMSEPSGAQVIRADQAEGPRLTPAVFRLHKGDPSFDVLIKLDGYKSQTRTINAKETMAVEVHLAKDETAAAPMATPTEPKKKRHGSGSPTGAPTPKGEDDLKTLPPVFN